MRKYIKFDGVVAYHKQAPSSGTIDISVITLPEKLFILTFYTETNREITADWVSFLLPHLSRNRIKGLIDHYRVNTDEYYYIRDGVMMRMF